MTVKELSEILSYQAPFDAEVSVLLPEKSLSERVYLSDVLISCSSEEVILIVKD